MKQQLFEISSEHTTRWWVDNKTFVYLHLFAYVDELSFPAAWQSCLMSFKYVNTATHIERAARVSSLSVSGGASIYNHASCRSGWLCMSVWETMLYAFTLSSISTRGLLLRFMFQVVLQSVSPNINQGYAWAATASIMLLYAAILTSAILQLRTHSLTSAAPCQPYQPGFHFDHPTHVHILGATDAFRGGRGLYIWLQCWTDGAIRQFMHDVGFSARQQSMLNRQCGNTCFMDLQVVQLQHKLMESVKCLYIVRHQTNAKGHNMQIVMPWKQSL